MAQIIAYFGHSGNDRRILQGLPLVPSRPKPDLVANQVGHGKSVEMAKEGFYAVGQYMTQTADRGDKTAAVSAVKTFHEGSIFFKRPDDLADIDCGCGLVEQQSAAAAANAVDKALCRQPLGHLHQMVF